MLHIGAQADVFGHEDHGIPAAFQPFRREQLVAQHHEESLLTHG
jgi:hypothetical protein